MADAVEVSAHFLPFLVPDEESEDAETMGGLFSRDDARVTLRQIPIEVLRESLRSTISTLSSILTEIADQSMAMQLHEAQIGFEVSASGGVQLIGTAQVGTKGAITLVFRRDQ
jgi:hypothetical protein